MDVWLGQYNNERTHSGKYCYGKTPIRTFVDSIPLAREKLFGHDESDGLGVCVFSSVRSRLDYHKNHTRRKTLLPSTQVIAASRGDISGGGKDGFEIPEM